MREERPKDRSSLQRPDLRMKNRDNCYVAKKDLDPERSDLPKVTQLLAVKLDLEPGLLPCSRTQSVGCFGILRALPACTEYLPWARPGDRTGDDMGMGSTPILTSGAHSPGEGTHVYTHTHTEQYFKWVS